MLPGQRAGACTDRRQFVSVDRQPKRAELTATPIRSHLRASRSARPVFGRRIPYETNGKVFFTNDGSNYVCSGTSVSVPDGREVWTAGHCVANTDGTHLYDTSFVFDPAYNGNATKSLPKGVWAGREFGHRHNWINNGDFTWDEAAAEMVNQRKHGTVTLCHRGRKRRLCLEPDWIRGLQRLRLPAGFSLQRQQPHSVRCRLGRAGHWHRRRRLAPDRHRLRHDGRQ